MNTATTTHKLIDLVLYVFANEDQFIFIQVISDQSNFIK